MSYDSSYNAAKARRYHFLHAELMSLCNTVPDRRSSHGRPVIFPLPTLFILLGLKFDSGLGYRDFVALIYFNPSLLERLGLDRAPSRSRLHSALKRLDTQLLHSMYELLARKRPFPKRVAVDSSGFSHSSGGEWMSLRFKKTLKRRFHALSALSPSTYFSTKFIEVAKFMAATVSSVIHNLHSTHFDDKSILVLTGPYCSECLSPAKFGRYVKVKETKCSKCGGKIVKAKKIKWG